MCVSVCVCVSVHVYFVLVKGRSQRNIRAALKKTFGQELTRIRK